jgi:hypothetical protein
MSGFTPYELYRVLIACGFTQVEIVQRNGPSERSLVTIGKHPNRKSNQVRILDRIAAEVGAFPWPSEIGERVRRVVELRDAKRPNMLRDEFSLTIALAQVIIERPSEDEGITGRAGRIGLLYLAAHYWYALAESSLLTVAFGQSERREAIKRAGDYFAACEIEIDKGFRNGGEPPCSTSVATLLRFKAAFNQFAMHWNGTRPTERASAEMARTIENSNLLEKALDYNDLFPKVFEAPYSALGVASRFGGAGRTRSDGSEWRSYYPDLWRRMIRIDDKYKKPESFEGFDEDFEDFKLWARENPEPILREKTQIKSMETRP